MHPNRKLNIGIFVASALVFAVALAGRSRR
jgi:hypothetical protein